MTFDQIQGLFLMIGGLSGFLAFLLAADQRARRMTARQYDAYAKARHRAAGHGYVGTKWERNVRRDIGRGARS